MQTARHDSPGQDCNAAGNYRALFFHPFPPRATPLPRPLRDIDRALSSDIRERCAWPREPVTFSDFESACSMPLIKSELASESLTEWRSDVKILECKICRTWNDGGIMSKFDKLMVYKIRISELEWNQDWQSSIKTVTWLSYASLVEWTVRFSSGL